MLRRKPGSSRGSQPPNGCISRDGRSHGLQARNVPVGDMSNQAKDQAKAKEIFREAIALLEEAPFDYAVGGGICTDHWTGGAQRINDIDLMIRKDDSVEILEVFADAGYQTAEMDHSWLHKTFKDGVTIDLMYELRNATTFDERFKEHRKQAELFGTLAYITAPEDQVAALVATADRETIGVHWFDIIDMMAKNDLEWGYLIARSQRMPLRMLSAIHFALSEQVPVQKGVIEQLNELVADSDR